MERLIERPMQRHAGHTPFVARLRHWDWDAEQLYDAARAIEDLFESPGWQLLGELLAEAKATKERTLVYGGVISDHVEAAKLTGEIAGLDAARNAAEAIVLRHQAKVREIEESEEAQ